MTTQFKVGDTVKVVNASSCDESFYGLTNGTVSKIVKINATRSYPYYLEKNPDREMGQYQLILITPNTNTMTNIIKKFTSLFTTEPQKSYQKAGITDENNVLTDEGLKIYATYLLNKDTTFKAEVVDQLLAEEK